MLSEDEKELLKIKLWVSYRQDLDGNVIAWKREANEHSFYISEFNESYDVSYKNGKDEQTLYNGADSIEEAISICENFALDNGIDLDSVKPVFNADPKKLASDIDEFCREIDESYATDNPDKEKKIEEIEKALQTNQLQELEAFLFQFAFTLQEIEAEQNMAKILCDRIKDYKENVARHNADQKKRAMQSDKERAASIISGSGKINIKYMIKSFSSPEQSQTQEAPELMLNNNQ